MSTVTCWVYLFLGSARSEFDIWTSLFAGWAGACTKFDQGINIAWLNGPVCIFCMFTCTTDSIPGLFLTSFGLDLGESALFMEVERTQLTVAELEPMQRVPLEAFEHPCAWSSPGPILKKKVIHDLCIPVLHTDGFSTTLRDAAIGLCKRRSEIRIFLSLSSHPKREFWNSWEYARITHPIC